MSEGYKSLETSPIHHDRKRPEKEGDEELEHLGQELMEGKTIEFPGDEEGLGEEDKQVE